MSQRSQFSALQEIRAWTLQDVLTALNRNGLEDCCAAFQKREIDGDNLLQLTEGKLALWKRDLSQVTLRKLTQFLNNISASPEKYVLREYGRQNGKQVIPPKPHMEAWVPPRGNSDSINVPPLPPRPQSPESDTGSWDTDFEDDPDQIAATEEEHIKPPPRPNQHFGNTNPSVGHKATGGHFYSRPPAPSNKSFGNTSLSVRPKPTGGHFNSKPSDHSNQNFGDTSPSLRPKEMRGNFNPKPPALSNQNSGKTNQSNKTTGGFLHSKFPAPSNVIFSETNSSHKPTIPNRPVALGQGASTKFGGHIPANTSMLYGPSLPKPPTPHLENLISNLDLAGGDHDYYDEEEYTSIDESLVPNRQALGFPVPSSIESKRENSPPYPKLAIGAIKSRPPALAPTGMPSKPTPSSLPGEASFNNIPPGIPNQMSGYAFRNQHSYRDSSPLPSTNHQQGPNLVGQQINTTGNSNDHLNNNHSSESSVPELEGYESEEYECIMENATETQADCYLQPVNFGVNSTPSPSSSVPALPSRTVAPEIAIAAPSMRPPSPPRKISKDNVEGVSGSLSEELRIQLKNREARTTFPSMVVDAREKTPTPELQKPSPFDQKPPPVERPGQFPSQYPTTQRPLPPTPDPSRKPGTEKMNSRRNSRVLTQMPWYHNVDRKRAEELLKNSEDGRFLLRPSAQTQNPLTLTLWYSKRLYNISVRQRSDQRYALGTEKAKEQSFGSVEELVQHYQGEELVLYSGGERTGKTLLTSSPPRQGS